MKIEYKCVKSPPPPSFKRFIKRMFGLDLFKGLYLTLRELFCPSTIVTIKYPLEKIPLSPRYRAVHRLMRLLESGNERCIGCGLCEKICVSNCIKIQTHLGADSRKHIDSYSINFGRCIYCGLCAEVCPELAIVHGYRYENASYARAHFKLKDDLLTQKGAAQNGEIEEYSGFGSISANASDFIKATPLAGLPVDLPMDSKKVLSNSQDSSILDAKTALDSAKSTNAPAKSAQDSNANPKLAQDSNVNPKSAQDSKDSNVNPKLAQDSKDSGANPAKEATC